MSDNHLLNALLGRYKVIDEMIKSISLIDCINKAERAKLSALREERSRLEDQIKDLKRSL